MRAFALLVVLIGATGLARAETLSFARLKSNESIVIGYRTNAVERKYVVTGGKAIRFEVFELVLPEKRVLLGEAPERFSGLGLLSGREARGLDAYVEYLRLRRNGECATVDLVGIGYFRDGKPIGEEKFVNRGCGLADFLLDESGVLVPELIPAGVSPVIFQAIVPPWLIEERIGRTE